MINVKDGTCNYLCKILFYLKKVKFTSVFKEIQ